MMIAVLALMLAGCSPQGNTQQATKYPDVPEYGIVFELQKEEEQWKQKK
jgi:hypothetical protein